MSNKTEGTLFFDPESGRYDIRFGMDSFYGGLHCGECFWDNEWFISFSIPEVLMISCITEYCSSFSSSGFIRSFEKTTSLTNAVAVSLICLIRAS